MRPSLFLCLAVLSWVLPFARTALAQEAAPAAQAGSARASEPAPDPDRWVLQGSGRLVSGLGSTMGEGQGNDFITELGIRGDVLFGRRRPRFFGIGPALEFRDALFHTIEGAAGAMVAIPTAAGWPLQLSVLGGWAQRFRFEPKRADGAVLVTNLAFGYRPFNYLSRYAYGVNFYVSGRVHLDDPHAYEITGGLELDLALAFFIPAGMMRMATTREDPDEYVEEAE